MTEEHELAADEESVDWPPSNGDAVVVAEQGVRVRKWVTDRGAAVPVVTYDIASLRDEAVTLELHDRTPDALEPDEFGFHDDYEAENWRRIGEHDIAFLRRLEPSESVTTLYGVRRESLDDAEPFLTNPSVTVSVGGGESGGDREDAAGEAVSTIDFGGGEMEMTDLDEFDSDGEVDAEVETLLQGGDPTAGRPADERAGGEPVETDSFDAGDVEAVPSGSGGETVGGTLAAELRDGRVSAADQDAIAESLNLELSESTAAFLDRLRDRVGQRRDRMERELEELDESITELYGLKADAADVEQARAELAELVEATADIDRLEALERQLEALSERAAEDGDLQALSSRLDDLDERVATAESLAETDDRLDELEETAASAAALDALTERLDDHETATDEAIEATRDDLQSRLANVRSDHETSMTSLRREREAATTDVRDDVTERVDDLRADTAADVAAIEETLETTYVTQRDVDAVIDDRLERRLRAIVFVALGSGGVLLSFVLASTGSSTLALGSFVAGALLVGGWWYLQPGSIVPGRGTDDSGSAADGAVAAGTPSSSTEVEATDDDDAPETSDGVTFDKGTDTSETTDDGVTFDDDESAPESADDESGGVTFDDDEAEATEPDPIAEDEGVVVEDDAGEVDTAEADDGDGGEDDEGENDAGEDADANESGPDDEADDDLDGITVEDANDSDEGDAADVEAESDDDEAAEADDVDGVTIGSDDGDEDEETDGDSAEDGDEDSVVEPEGTEELAAAAVTEADEDGAADDGDADTGDDASGEPESAEGDD
ncbi:hypothetical protein [Haloarchaeobius sp. HRN-SO-5]|uniref:ATP-binding protein n=1 Tax=Haloarchaeobius sp. HRN-SO-5 TaxID=3446118 RepID=UPI003EBBEF01